MTSPGHSSDEDFLGSLGISLDPDLTADADTHTSVTGIYAQTEYFPYTRPELIHADLGLGLVPLAWRWYRTNLQTVRRRKSLRDLRTFFDICTVEQPIGSRFDDFQAPSQPPITHSSRASGPSTRTLRRRPQTDPSSSTPVEGPSRAGSSRSVGPSRAPRAILEATGSLHPGLANLRLPYSISYHTPDGTLAFRDVSLEKVDRLDLPPDDITEVLTDKSLTKRIHMRFDIDLCFLYDFQVPTGLVNQMMGLMLGMQQELSSSWTLGTFDDQRRRRPRR
ncbi:hypothetical protein JCGZ_02990 [Jatropha curcas]|uniref:Aminotransferase-like plant mobile domain-containing protein n=1 Tax=Jatropha curcas TaxID=180498 RepID=A0A067JGU1_JATCU|nr:hypothetical protein JCGZ_02990 [Jatropha curcas]